MDLLFDDGTESVDLFLHISTSAYDVDGIHPADICQHGEAPFSICIVCARRIRSISFATKTLHCRYGVPWNDETVSMLRITASRISLSGDLYDSSTSSTLTISCLGMAVYVSLPMGRDRIGSCLAETFHLVIKSTRFDIVLQTPVIVRKPNLAAFQYQFVLFFH